MALTRVDSDLRVAGEVSAETMTLPDGTVTNAMVNASAAIAYTKQQHQHRPVVSQESATAAADEIYVAHVVVGTTGAVVGFACGAVVANVGVAVVDFDLLNNGVSILVAPVQIDNGDAAYAIVDGVIATPALAADDVLEISIDGTIGGGALAQGCFAFIDLYEDAQ